MEPAILFKKINRKIHGGITRNVRLLLTGSKEKQSKFDPVHARLFRDKKEEELVIFDVGAHVGESARRFRGVFPKSYIHCFEADKGNYQKLCENLSGQSDLHLNNFGVGSAAATQKFYKNMKTDTSSFNQVNPESEWAEIRSKQYGVEKSAFTQESYDVEIKALDTYMDESGIEHVDLLKIDTQGYEDEVLKGASEALKANKIDVIETEIIMGDLYNKSLSFNDLENILLPLGYKFFAIDRAGDFISCPTLSFNLIYVSKEFLKKVL